MITLRCSDLNIIFLVMVFLELVRGYLQNGIWSEHVQHRSRVSRPLTVYCFSNVFTRYMITYKIAFLPAFTSINNTSGCEIFAHKENNAYMPLVFSWCQSVVVKRCQDRDLLFKYIHGKYHIAWSVVSGYVYCCYNFDTFGTAVFPYVIFLWYIASHMSP